MTTLKKIIVLLGDIIVLYGALVLALMLRYGLFNFTESLINHLKPFSLIFIIWLVIFYLADLYKDKNSRITPGVIQGLGLTIAISVIASIIFFYLFPSFFQLTPKTNLIVFALIFGILDLAWRFIVIKISISSGLRDRLLIIGDSKSISESIDFLKINPQLGYDVVCQIKEYNGNKNKENILELINDKQITTIAIHPRLKDKPNIAKVIYQLLPLKVNIIDSITLYEMVFQKIPLDELEESWFIEKIVVRRNFYDFIKRTLDILLSMIFGVIFLPICLIIAILTKLSPRQRPAIFRPVRVGINDKDSILYKFGVMKEDGGALATAKNDERLTILGKILNRTHLNELPQLYNIFRGDISFVGPRAESRELVEIYEQLPHYEIRHIIKPGLTGWAQLNYKPSASLEEAKEKLQYDLYYIKNRYLVLDLMILLKTIRYLFLSHH